MKEHVSRKTNWSFHNSLEKKIDTSSFTKKNGTFNRNLRNLWYLKVTIKLSLGRCLYHLSTSCTARSKKKSEQEHEGWLSCHGHYILLITVERHNQNHVSRRIKYFFLIPRINILENHASNKITIYEKRQAISHFTRIWAHSRITKIPFTTLVKVRQLINIS